MIRSLLLALGTLVLIAPTATADNWEPVDSELWVPLPDTGQSPTLQLATPEGRPVRGTWRALGSGDTLRFAIRGTGTLRVETRALLQRSPSEVEYRIGVRTAPDSVRLLLRRSSDPQSLRLVDPDGAERPVRAAETDRWETPLVGGSERVEVFLREARDEPVLVRVLVEGELERPSTRRARSTEVEWALEAGVLGAGIDTNAYLAPSDSAAAETAFFWPAVIDAGLRIDPGGRFDLGFDYAFDGTFHRDSILDTYRHQADAWQRWRHLSLGGAGDFELQLEQVFRTRNRTYFGRGYNEELETASGTPPIENDPLADRFDWREGQLLAGIEFGPRTGWSADVEAGYVRRNYVEDYEDDPATYSLDQDRWVGRWRVQWRNETDLWVRAGVAVEDRFYDEKFARQSDGTENPQVQSHLTYWPVEVEFGRRPRAGLRWDLGLERERIVDRYQGYWDRTDWTVAGDADWVTGEGHRVGVRLRRSITHYDRSRVGNTPTGPIREKDLWFVGLDALYRLDRHWRIEAWTEFKDRNNNSPAFDYSRWVSMAGFVCTF